MIRNLVYLVILLLERIYGEESRSLLRTLIQSSSRRFRSLILCARIAVNRPSAVNPNP